MPAKLAIWQSFLQLLHHQYADDISVGQICQQANVHRSTFYRHFRDIFALVDWGISYQFSISTQQNETFTLPLIQFLNQYRTALRHLNTVKYNYRFQQAICGAVEKQVLQQFQAAKHAYISPIAPDWMAKFYVGGMAHIMMQWLQNGSYGDISIEQLHQQCLLLRQQTMRNCLKID